VAFKDGFTTGDKESFDANIAQERIVAFEAGKKALIEEYATSGKAKFVTTKLVDANGNGKFEAGEKFSLEVSVRNFGGVALPKGKLVIVVEDQAKSLTLSANTAILKELAPDTQARFFNVLSGTVLGGNDLLSIKLKVSLLEEGKELGSFLIESNVENTFKLRAFSNPVNTKVNGWFSNKVWIDNISKTATATGLKLKITSRDKRVTIYQKEIPMNSIQPNGTGVYEFWIQVNQNGDYSKNILDLNISDAKGRVLFNSGYVVPLKVN
jgi:hypothetical protein